MNTGRFITVEGIDGAGKSSHLEFLASAIRARGAGVVVTREPGGTPLGEKLRALALNDPMEGTTEALVMFAARREHLVRVIEPALGRGDWVLSDRFSDATYAYQCGGRGLPASVFLTLERLVHPDRQPDATFLFDLDPAIAYERQRAQSRDPDRFEREAADFFRCVREAYLERAGSSGGRVHVVDASGSLEGVRDRLAQAFARAFP
ncbi:MAG: dTMP kinase [Betaproteobacteria bacterium]|nr:dTMP kinase [Betaproteobacteria bacterium]